jgi:hypothetical protein
MQRAKLFGITIIATVALSAIASATASAALPEFLPGNAGEKFTGTSPSGTLEINALEKITCSSDSVAGENVGATKKEASATVTFKGCSAFGIAGAKSLGEAEGTIVSKVKLKLCYINIAKKEVGVLTKVASPVHIEVAGKLLVVEGDQVAKITPTNVKTKEFKLTYEESGGKPKPDGCQVENEKKEVVLENEHLASSVNEGAAKESGEATTETTTYEKEQTLDA